MMKMAHAADTSRFDQLVVTFAWDVGEAICIVKRAGNRGLHPGVIVGFDLVLWLAWAVVSFYLPACGLATRGWYLIRNFSGYDHNGYYSFDPSKITPEDARLLDEVVGKGRAMIAFAGLLV